MREREKLALLQRGVCPACEQIWWQCTSLTDCNFFESGQESKHLCEPTLLRGFKEIKKKVELIINKEYNQNKKDKQIQLSKFIRRNDSILTITSDLIQLFINQCNIEFASNRKSIIYFCRRINEFNVNKEKLIEKKQL